MNPNAKDTGIDDSTNSAELNGQEPKGGIVKQAVLGISGLAMGITAMGIPGKATAEDVNAALTSPSTPVVLAANTGTTGDKPLIQQVNIESETGTTDVEVSDSDKLAGFLYNYIDPEAAADYEFYLNDMENALYSDLRQSDAIAVLEMYEADGVLQEGVKDRNSERIVVSVLTLFSTEQTPVGAGMMEKAIARLHRTAPETTEQAIAYAASVFGNIEGETLYSPWSTAVNVASNYGVEYDANSRSAQLETSDEDTIVKLASNLK